jgi:hypothetical protein
MTVEQRILDFYAKPAAITDAGSSSPLLAALPVEPRELARVEQGLIIHEHIAPQYGQSLSDERRSEVHTRPVRSMLQCFRDHDAGPLTAARPPENRAVGDCRHFSVLAVSVLRAHGVPARARCGFGAYFEPGKHIDHWVCEYWNSPQSRWVRFDAQIDQLQHDLFKIGFDLYDVPRDRFLIAGDAWERCRNGKADPASFGVLDMGGLWFIAGNLVRDFASLNKVEMLPWDAWGGMPMPNEQLEGERLAFFDRIAALTQDPDANFEEVRSLYERDERLKVPSRVFNVVRGVEEEVGI